MSIEPSRTVRELQMLEGMVDCTHVLGMAFGAAAQAESDVRRSLDRLDAFQKCFLAVRMGIRLSMSLRAGRTAATPVRATAVERPEAPERDPPEPEGVGRGDPVERERDRDYEPVSLPTFLRTLGVVAREAARLGDQLPVEAKSALPALQGLLAEAQDAPSAARTTGRPPTGVAVLARPAPPGRTRDRLMGSAATSLPGLSPPGPRPRSGVG